ncbi:MAG: serine hydrolase domain-containing protein [Actinomycetota bacterium]
MKDRLDEVLAAGIERGAAPGASFVVVDRDGATYEGAAGARAIGGDVAMTPDSVGAIFSMTKAITGAAAMQLVEQGHLSLDAPASKVLPELADPQVLDGLDDDGQPILRPAVGDITLRNLLTHTSGFVYDIWNERQVRWSEATGALSLFTLQKEALRTPLAFDPGTAWEYGIGIDWAGLMIEAVTGQTLGEYFAEHLTGPLGMADTAFAHTPSMLERACGVHARMPDGSFAPMELPAPEAPEFEMGGGGLQGTMTDYGRFIQMVLNDGELDGTRVLGTDTVADMVVNHIGPLRVNELLTAMPPFSNDAELFPGEEKSWGLTFQIHEQAGSTGRPAGTLMWAGLANSYFWIDRTNGIGGAYLSQILPFADPGSVELFMELETAVYAER